MISLRARKCVRKKSRSATKEAATGRVDQTASGGEGGQEPAGWTYSQARVSDFWDSSSVASGVAGGDRCHCYGQKVRNGRHGSTSPERSRPYHGFAHVSM